MTPQPAPTAARPTPGEWRIDGQELIPGLSDTGQLLHAVIRSPDERWTALVEVEDNEGHANAALIAEAGTVLSESGHTPRQLLEERDGLAEVLAECITYDGAPAERSHTLALKRLVAISESARYALARLGKERA